ncbi:MAG TPA: TonB-dependent receptor [Opitutaceae bacterium]|nr:TonB-dependent receptor [Opitutaceae bacterium]
MSSHLLRRPRRWALILALALPAAVSVLSPVSAVAQTAATGSLTGRVSNKATGSYLEGAVIRIIELNRTVATAREGQYLLTGIPAGEYTLRVSYEGLDDTTLSVAVAAGGVARADAALETEVFMLGELQVAARVEGQAAAINLQRNAPTLRTVVSSDALGQIREGNIGDALVRLPGVSVETRAGVQRTATIRGLAPQYNTVTVDGLRMTNVDGNRDIALDSFPSNMLASMEVIKAQMPDFPSDAIGGVVNLVTKTAYDSADRIIEGDVGTTYNDLRGNWNRQASFNFGDTFGANKQFGFLTSFAYFHDQRGYDVAQTAYTTAADNTRTINRTLYYDRYEVKDKVGAGLALDYRPGSGTTLFAKALYNYDYRFLNHYGTDWRPNPAAVTARNGDVVSSTGGRVDAFAFYREPKNVFQMYVLGGTHQVGDWDLDFRTAWSKAKKDYPATIQIVNSFNGVNLTYDRSTPDFPSFRVDNAVNVNNPAGLAFRQVDSNQVPRVEDEWSYDANLKREFNAGTVPWTLKAGIRYTQKDSSQAQPLTVRYSGLTGIPTVDLIEYHATPGFMGAANGNAVLLGFYPDWKKYRYLVNNPGNLTQNAAAVLFTDETKANADFESAEDILGAYVQGSATIGALDLLAGLRWEQTETGSRANRVVTSGGQVVSVTRVSDGNRYDNLLPGLHARHRAMNGRLITRAAVTKALSRPPPGDLIPSVQENAQINQRVIGNPNLEPAESLNYDVSVEYYLPPLGVLSAGLFKKEIEKFVFASSRIAADGVDERSRVNGDGGDITGLELVWSQQLKFLPGFLGNLGVDLNYTWLDSEGRYPNRPNDSLPFVNAPDYIFNAIVSYAAGPLSIRVSYNELPERLESVGGRAALDSYNAASKIWDLAAKYSFRRNYTLFLNVKNLTDTPTVQFQGDRRNPTSVTYYGTQYNFGVQYKF